MKYSVVQSSQFKKDFRECHIKPDLTFYKFELPQLNRNVNVKI